MLYAFWFLRDAQLWIPIWIVFLTLNRGFSLTQVTLAEGLFLVGVVVLEVPTGAVADRWGRSRSLALGALFLGVAVLIFAFITSFALLLTSFLLWSVASTLMSGADMALLFDTLKAEGREADFERISGRGMAFSWTGAGLATLAGGPVAYWTNIETTIYFGAATCLVTAFVALSMWEPPHARPAHAERYWGTIRAAFGEMWHVTDVRSVVLLAGTAVAALEGVHYLVQPYLIDRGVEVGVRFSMLQAPMLGAGVLGALAAGRLAVRAGAVGAITAIPMVAASAFLLLAFAPGLSGYLAFPIIFALGSCLRPITGGYVNRRIGSERRATVLSIQAMVTSLILAVLAPTLGFTTDRWALDVAFGVAAVVAVLAVVLFAGPLWRKRGSVAAPVGAVER